MTAYLGIWLLTIASGMAIALALLRPGVAGRWSAALGHGAVLGMLASAAATALAARADTAHAWKHAAPWLAAVAVAAAVVAWRRRAAPAPAAGRDGKVEKWKLAVALLALASLAWRAWLVAAEVSLRPTYPWDAWDAWAVKSKAWFLLGHYVPFVDAAQWLRSAAGATFSGPAWAYPSTLGWLQVWFASGAGAWVEPLVNLPWLVLWLGLLLGHYGQWRALGVDRGRALLFVYLLGSLPLLTSHVALAGYADLWIATLFGFSVLAWLRWQTTRDRGQLVLAIACAAILPLVKLEGTVWCVAILAACGFGLLPPRWRWRVVVAALVLAALLVVIGQARWLFAAVGWVRSGSRMIDIPVIGHLALAWHGDAAVGIVHGLFAQSNWNLLWWIVPPLVAWRWRVLRDDAAVRLFALLLLACLALLAFLFVFTDAAEWAESFTAVNRLVMQVTPAVVSLLALLTRTSGSPARADTGPAPDPRSAPA